jgi:hypothetical protein
MSNISATRYGWFASYANTQYGRIVTVRAVLACKTVRRRYNAGH